MGFLNKQTDWEKTYYYQKSEVIYQMTYSFCNRFIPLYGDRTRDQMIQAARSCKQNIVEGHADGVTSTEMQVKLINVARASIRELLEDYIDYAKAHSLTIWDKTHPRFNSLLHFCKFHNSLDDYQPFFSKWGDEEYCNTAISLCHIVDKILFTHINALEKEFIENGGIKERMHKARTDYRSRQDEELLRLQQEVPLLKAEINRLQGILKDNGISF
ncbi:MAG: four helix bundle suffix domain-containing protein [Paludibacteraceae bacterium]|nr:four helix bundle suffix domain-containing protein [Paludibacteraceae bacterium]